MASEVVCGLVFRLLLPVCLAAACLFRYNGLSFVYLIYLLLIPLFAEPTRATMQGHTGRLLKSLCFISISFLIVHIIYQITIHSLLAGEAIDAQFNCSSWEKSMRQIGFESVIGADGGNGIRVFIPDIGMFMAGLGTWMLCQRSLMQKRAAEGMAQDNTEFEPEELDDEKDAEKVDLDDNILFDEDFDAEDEAEDEEDMLFEEEDEEEEEEEVEESTKMKILRHVAGVASKVKEVIGNLITTAGKVVVTILLGLTGIMLPSVTSLTYFLVFMGLCTWWSLCRTFDTLLFSCLCVLMAIFSAGHIVVLYLYQFQFIQESFSQNDTVISVFGISPVIQTDCTSTWRFVVNPTLEWHHFVNPIMILVLYYTLATLIRLWLQEPLEEEEEEPEENEGDVAVGNSSGHTAGHKRQQWWKAHQRTDERNLLSTQDGTFEAIVVSSNGTSFDYVSTRNTGNGPVGMDVYSTPQYKVDQTNEISEKKDSGVYEVTDITEEEKPMDEVDGEEEEEEEEGEEEEAQEEKGPNAVVKVFRFVMKQSYICALIAMMAWSITYVSWLTFVLLLWSCMLWMVRDRRRYAMLSSPFMVAYGNLILLLQYIWSIERVPGVPGLFLKSRVPFSDLGSKMLCLLSFWLLLHQTLMERQDKLNKEAEAETETVLSDVKVDTPKKEDEEKEDGDGDENDLMQVLGNMVMGLLVKYWIYICGGMFFFVSFQGRIVMYKIIYMMMFLFCVALYQVHYEWWRRILKYFWMSVVVYTMLVLILVYTYQFENSPRIWHNMTGWKEEKLKDLGLEQFVTTELFARIFIPTSFLLVTVLHLHYFHERFLQLTDLKAVVTKQESSIYSHAKVSSRVYLIMNSIKQKIPSPENKLAHPEGSLADITMLSSSPDPLLKEQSESSEREPEEGGGSEKLVLVVKGLEGPKSRQASLMLSSQEESVHSVRSTASEPEPPSDQSSDLKNKWHLVVDRLTVLFLKFLEYFHKLQLFIWWLLEIHIIKIVSSYIILVSVKEVSLFNYVFLVSWAFAMPYGQFRPHASSVCTIWTCIIIICKMLYQLESIEPVTYSSNCSMPDGYQKHQADELKESLLYKDLVDPSNWVGLKKFDKLLENLRNNLLMLAILAFEVTIYRHQEYYRLHNGLSPPPSRTIFHDITRQHLDMGIVNCAKYFINYFFYKFGLEVCFLLVVNVIGQRMDFYAMLHAFGLIAVMYRRRRKAIAEIWPKYCCFLACLLTLQYFVCIGIPPAACKDYPWRFPNSTTDSNVIKWLYLPDFHTKPNPSFLAYDFMLLLCASLQRQVFDDENKAAVRLMAGDNVEICRDLDAASFSVYNPVPDFIHCRSYLDMLKVIMFSYLFWFVLTIIFITGTTRISVFCMGYLVACFYFLLFGGDLLLKPIKKILHYWDFLIAYNIFVITMKNILSILACGYIKDLMVNQCWLIQLFSLACTIKEYKVYDEIKAMKDETCELPSDEAGIIWDSICFAFLLLQRRVFMSYYFLHVVADIRAAQILASRGAELFQATIVKAVKARLEEENKSMEQLKRQMDRIKTRQQKFKKGKEKILSMTQESSDGQNLIPPEEEDDDDGAEKKKAKKKQWWRPWVDHASMVRSGDYYLFETDSEEEEEEEEKKEEEPPKKSAFQRAVGKFASAVLALPKSIIKLPKLILHHIVRVAKFVYHTWITDSKTALKERSKEKRRFWKKYARGRHKKSQKEGHVTIEVGDSEQSENEEEGKKSPDNIIKRVFNIIKFTWVLLLTTIDSLTMWMNSMCREYIDISTVLRIERCMLTREVKKGNVPSRESIQVYYQKQMSLAISRESGLDRISEEDSMSGSQRVRRRRAGYRDYSQDSRDSIASRDSMSSAYTEATMLFSRQSTLDDLDEMPENIPKTSERARPKLRKMYGLDMSNSSADSGSSIISSEPTQCVTLFSRQGTNDTIEEVEGEKDQAEEEEQEVQQEQEQEQAEPVEQVEPVEQPEEELEGDASSLWPAGGDVELGVEREEEAQEAHREGAEAGETRRPSGTEEEDNNEEVREHAAGHDEGESSGLEYLHTDGREGQLFTPDTDAPNTSDADVPPSYSKAVSFDRLSVSTDGSGDDRRMMIMTPDSRSDLDDSLLPSMTTELTASELLLNKMFYDDELENSERFYKGQPQLLQLCYALYNMLVAHSEMVCYLVIILNHMISAYAATLVLPILIFLWAMLSVPRPSKRFWMTAIVYTEATIIIKYFFQFGFFPFNQQLAMHKNRPFHPPNIIGTEKKEGYVHYDLVQLLALFFHRSILKCHGLWDDDGPRPSPQKDTTFHRDESEDEEKAVSIHSSQDRKGSVPSMRSINFGTSIDSVQMQVQVQVRTAEQRTYQRRRRSSGGTSHLSRHSSLRSKRGSTSTRNSSKKDGSEAEVHQKTRKEMIIEKIREQLIKARVFIIKRALEIYLPIRQFFYDLVHPDYSAVTDVYVMMFLADTVDFIIIVFGFTAFGKHTGGADIASSLSEDQVPGAFLVMVLIQFGTMVVDRALYLKKTVVGKVIFQVILVFGIHFWMFFILPGVTERRFGDNRVAQIWYFVKCIYFGLSAYQIRCGYPTRVLGNFLTKSYNYVNLFLFQGFRLIPFLTELRAVMDWVWTDTTLSLSSWICVEDIYAHIFVLKCWRESEKRYPQPRGQKKKKVVKYGMGGMIVMLLICIVWFPLLFMSLVKSVAGVVNRPLDVSLKLQLGGFEHIFTMSAQQNHLRDISEDEFNTFLKIYGSDTDVMPFLESYTFEDLTIAELEGSSNSLWTISPPSRKTLIQVLGKTEDEFTITIDWSVQRDLELGAKAEVSSGKYVTNLDNKTRIELVQLLNGTRKDSVILPHIFPQYMRAPSDSSAKPIVQFYKDEKYMNITLNLGRPESTSNKTKSANETEVIQEWWIVNQTRAGELKSTFMKPNKSGLELYVFSDKVSPPSLGFLAGYGIMGLYASVVLVIGKFVREFFSGIHHTIMFEELPNVDRILKLCTDIFLVRETGELDLEEDLYAKLIFLYRSPETMIKWTREKTQ
ncbi:piezo-type mechanosensitive ion channel component 2 [Alosa sapidissima]|uniref:piezo-type mechanosensitive ion channel component 2 n=1 Tax=Alosa sapidissima TaxID=34773 RepID=UPI001C098A62|nr:piezo-type mechanosensitive ion channel component 2 [Alosa sapidissima]